MVRLLFTRFPQKNILIQILYKFRLDNFWTKSGWFWEEIWANGHGHAPRMEEIAKALKRRKCCKFSPTERKVAFSIFLYMISGILYGSYAIYLIVMHPDIEKMYLGPMYFYISLACFFGGIGCYLLFVSIYYKVNHKATLYSKEKRRAWPLLFWIYSVAKINIKVKVTAWIGHLLQYMNFKCSIL